jgi:hypothetical protein
MPVPWFVATLQADLGDQPPPPLAGLSAPWGKEFVKGGREEKQAGCEGCTPHLCKQFVKFTHLQCPLSPCFSWQDPQGVEFRLKGAQLSSWKCAPRPRAGGRGVSLAESPLPSLADLGAASSSGRKLSPDSGMLEFKQPHVHFLEEEHEAQSQELT